MGKTFYRYVKAFLALEVRKSVPESLAFVKFDFLAFTKIKLLDLVTFIMFDRFSIFLLIPIPLPISLLPALPSIF